ncbi:hypothetical protein M3P21_17240 [Ruegeria sp. 2012CJ41-6]|uniref:NAD(P)-dependent oxidoreductase n=1 Tax=Ruegeria spongiae TaxID=2942209 RepID=A0ABT0Q5W6_9RHOB|nr:hypothetical protein [Ruegeria spongiae]MCL6285276.1 hypothetical protein [Ruegeria spongiae]
MRGLIGYTGFVGQNVLRHQTFDACYNSSNIDQIAGRPFDLLVCSAAPATMWLANQDPDADRANLEALLDRVRSARVDRLVLISTIAVFQDASQPLTETTEAFETDLAYGSNRRALEVEAMRTFDDVTVLRLPALFGEGLKKNFIFDILNPVPSFLKPDVFEAAMAAMDAPAVALLERAFALDDDIGMWRFDRSQYGRGRDGALLREAFEAFGTTALAFTNPASRFQFYDLANLWADIERALQAGIDVLNVATPPIAAREIYQTLAGEDLPDNAAPVVLQDIRSRHCAAWDRDDGYLYARDDILGALRSFCVRQRAGAA